MAEITASPERLERYAEVAVAALDLNVLRAHDRLVADEVAAKFMAVADAEQAELRTTLLLAEANAASLLEVSGVWRGRAMTAEAAVARAGALTVHLHTDLIYRGDLLAALAGPKRHVCPECEQGKHANCDGTAWDHLKDEPTSCTCLHETDDEAELGRLHDEGEAP